MKYVINIIETGTGKIVEKIKAKSERGAERVEGGVNINLNHEKYHTEIKETNNG